MTSPTLTATLAHLGYRHEPPGTAQNGRRIIDAETGEDLGVMTAGEAWEWVHEIEASRNAARVTTNRKPPPVS